MAEQKIEIKLKLLKLSNEQTQKIVEERNLKTIERYRKLLEGKINECHELKAEVQEKKLENGDGVKGVRSWSVKVAEIPTFGDKKTGGCTSSRDFGSSGGFGAFCLKICGILVQQDEFSTTLRSRLAVCKVRNERNLS